MMAKFLIGKKNLPRLHGKIIFFAEEPRMVEESVPLLRKRVT